MLDAVYNITIHIFVPLFVAVLASSGVWRILESRMTKPKIETQLLIGLAHDRIVYLGIKYIERGWIYHDEHENLTKYLYAPYKTLGGNGSAERIMNEINRLPIKHHSMAQIKQGESK